MPAVVRPDGARIFYDAAGPVVLPARFALTLAHGFGASHDMWWPQRGPLSERDRLILHDARGHGASTVPMHLDATPEAWSIATAADDLHAVLAAEGVADGAVIGGMSYGGMIALQYAVDRPQATRALILSDSVPRGDRPPRTSEPPGVSPAWRGMIERPDLTSALPGLTMPVLVLYGEHDRGLLDGVQRLASGLPQRRVVCLAGCSHGSSAQRPREWTEAVLQFLDDVDAGRPISGEVTV